MLKKTIHFNDLSDNMMLTPTCYYHDAHYTTYTKTGGTVCYLKSDGERPRRKAEETLPFDRGLLLLLLWCSGSGHKNKQRDVETHVTLSP